MFDCRPTRSQCKLRGGSGTRLRAGRRLQTGGVVTKRSSDQMSLSAAAGPATSMGRPRKLAVMARAAANARSTDQRDT